jgi:hypothetical protein
MGRLARSMDQPSEAKELLDEAARIYDAIGRAGDSRRAQVEAEAIAG